MPKCPLCKESRDMSEKEMEVHLKYFHKKVDSCPECGQQVIMQEGCKHCPSCGWSKCA